MSAELKPASLASFSAAFGNLNRAQWLELTKRHAPQLVAGLAVIGLAWQAAELTWLVGSMGSSAQSVSNAVPQTASIGAAATASNAVNPQTIANAHLFGIPGATSNADPNSLPQTQVNLVLAGTMALSDPEAGFAIVGDNAVNAKFFRVGATINGIARLHSVYTDRVVIERNGVLETLMLPHASSTGSTTPVRTAATSAAADNLRRLANANPEAIGNLLRAQPVFANGVLKGYRVYPGRDRQQFVRSGLQPGDLVTAINGTLLDDPNRGTEILNTLASSATALVAVERNGVVQQVNLDMTQLSIPDNATDSSSSTSAANPATNNPATNQRGNFGGPPGGGGFGGPQGNNRGGRNFGGGNGGPPGGGTPDTSSTQ